MYLDFLLERTTWMEPLQVIGSRHLVIYLIGFFLKTAFLPLKKGIQRRMAFKLNEQ